MKPSDNPSKSSVESVGNLSATAIKKDGLLETPDITADLTDNKNQDGVFTSVAGSSAPLKLTVKIKDNVWLNINVDGSREEDFILPKGTEKIFYGKDNFRITVGNRNAVNLKLNDNILDLPGGNENNVVRDFVINSKLIE